MAKRNSSSKQLALFPDSNQKNDYSSIEDQLQLSDLQSGNVEFFNNNIPDVAVESA